MEGEMRHHVAIVAVFDRYIEADSQDEARAKGLRRFHETANSHGFAPAYIGSLRPENRERAERRLDECIFPEN